MVINTTKEKMKKTVLLFAFCLAITIAFIQCRGKNKLKPTGDVLPTAPNYSESSQWYVSDRNSEADVFYIISTETGDYSLNDGITYHYANTYNDSVRGPLYSEMLGVDTLISGKLNYYSPYYRQCSLQSFTDQNLAKARMAVPLEDVRKAFDYYLKNLNHGRPFILAGFSQGAKIMLELMKEMDENTYQRMIAAYALGVTISQEMLDANKHIVAARSADDTGVTICYNSVKDANSAMNGWEKSAIAINPVNWRTDGQAATLITEPSPLVPIDKQKKDTLTIHIDKATNLLFVQGFTATDYVLPLIGKQGNYHSREIWLYRHQLCENIALRAAQFAKKQSRSSK